MARRRNRSVDAAYIPVASNAGDLAAMAQANAAFGEAMSGVGSAIKTGATDWAGHETDRAVQYLDTLADDQARNAALAQMQQDPIGAFLDVGAATKAVDAMQLRDFKVDERAEQALRADDLHKEAARALAQQKIMDPKEALHKDATIDSLTTTTAKTQKDIDWFDRKTKSAIDLEEVKTGLKEQKFTAAKKKLDDTREIGTQWETLRAMPLVGKDDDESRTLSLNQLNAVNKQIQANEAAGIYHDKEILKDYTRKHLEQSEYKISDEMFIKAGVGSTFTPGSHDALRLAIMTDLSRQYPTNTDAEIRKHANKIIDTYPGNLKTHFKWGADIAGKDYDQRKAIMYEKGMDKQLKEIQEQKDPKKQLQKIAQFKKLNATIAVPPEQTRRFLNFTTPILEKFAASINAEKVFLDSLPDQLTGNKAKGIPRDEEFTKKLREDTAEFGLTTAIRLMDIRKFSPTLQRRLYRNIEELITKDLGPMTRAELAPIRNLVLGENPVITRQFSLNKQIVETSDKLTAVSQDLQVELAELDKKTILGFRDSLPETIIRGVEDRSVKLGTFEDINGKQLEKSVVDTIKKIKDTLGVDSSWSKKNQYALNIAIGGLFQSIRVDPDIEGNDYVIPHIAMGTDIRELPINALIEGLKEHLEFASSKVQGATLFDKTVKDYIKANPKKEESFYHMILKKSPFGMATEIYDNPSGNIFNP